MWIDSAAKGERVFAMDVPDTIPLDADIRVNFEGEIRAAHRPLLRVGEKRKPAASEYRQGVAGAVEGEVHAIDRGDFGAINILPAQREGGAGEKAVGRLAIDFDGSFRRLADTCWSRRSRGCPSAGAPWSTCDKSWS